MYLIRGPGTRSAIQHKYVKGAHREKISKREEKISELRLAGLYSSLISAEYQQVFVISPHHRPALGTSAVVTCSDCSCHASTLQHGHCHAPQPRPRPRTAALSVCGRLQERPGKYLMSYPQIFYLFMEHFYLPSFF